ncbi:MAG TPA: DUF1572 family protein [Bryobacteraceae bacterium]|jgi:uncharacterized damage-inducible protein DinB|nr:DUF1572 family protein [Bryobacteraceae bacterium]
MDSTIAQLFLSYSDNKLQQMTGYIESCVARLSDDQLWSRGGGHENSIGNLILHLCGNMRQWIVAGVGGEKDIRDRDAEFAASGGLSGAELISRLRATVEQAREVIRRVTVARLLEEVNPQSGPVSVLEAIYQVVGHFQQHAGQIMFATKIYSGQDLGLYRP